jgi:hypothetical protein
MKLLTSPAPAARLAGPTRALLRDLGPALRAHRWLALAIGAHALAAAAVRARYHSGAGVGTLLAGYGSALLVGPLFALAGYALYVMLFIRPRLLLRHLGQQLRGYLNRERVLFALPALLLLALFAGSFTELKAAVPLIQPFALDRRLAELDLALHGGTAPWAWLQVVFGHPLLTAALNLAYHLWFFIMFGLTYWLVFSSERPALRMQFLFSFVLSWALLGNLMAVLLSSAGPCYYGYVLDGPNPYAAQMHYLYQADREVPLLALRVQELLWQDYRHSSNVSGMAISAMPSMHVASSVLMALAGWRLNRAAGTALTLFALLILAGSVHLGWHYAVDGYAGAIGAALLWMLVGRLQQAHPGALGGATPAGSHHG